VSAEPNPLDNLRRAAEELATEVSSLVPRLVDRSREQLAIAMSFAERLPCAGWFGVGGDSTPRRPDLHVVDDLDDLEDDGLGPMPASSDVAAAPATTTPAVKNAVGKPAAVKKAVPKKTAPKTAAPKTAGKKAAAKSSGPKKAAPKKAAPKKAAAKATATKSTAAKSTATKSTATKSTATKSTVTVPPEKAAGSTTAPRAAGAGAAGGLAIPDYDELAASQVIPRLDSLSPEELESIRLHEASHRSRRTILSRVAQLQAG
jgi:hypothetical protein